MPGGDTKDFFDAVELGDLSVVASMIRAHPALARSTDPRGKPPWARDEWPKKSPDPCTPLGISYSPKSHTALHIAACHGQIEVARLLILSGVDVNAADTRGRTPLRFAVSPRFKLPSPEMVRLLIGSGAEVANDCLIEALEYRRHYDPLPIAELLLDYGANPNVCNPFGSMLANALIRYPQNTALAELLVRHGADLNPQPLADRPLAPLLRTAARNRNPEVMRLLIEAGAYVAAACAHGALHAAAWLADDQSVGLLLQAGADPNAHANYGRTALDLIEPQLQVSAMLRGLRREPSRPRSESNIAAERRSWRDATVESLLKLEGAEGDLYHAIADGDREMVRRVVGDNSELLNINRNYWTPLGIAAAAGELEIATFLLDRGAPVAWCEGTLLQSALCIAAAYGRSRIVSFILERHTETKDSALYSAIRGGDPETVEILLRAGANIECRPKGGGRVAEGLTPLQVACVKCSIPVVEMLIRYGANVNPITPTDEYGWGEDCDIWPIFGEIDSARPLYIAVVKNSFELVDILLEAGADINALSFGWSALHAACLAPNLDMATHLVARGADVHIKSADGLTLLELLKGYRRCAELLEAAMST